MTDYEKISVAEFTEALASKTSVPGGGGASALCASIGAALGDMVGEYTIGKKTYADVEEDIKVLMDKAQDLRKRLLDCINKDAIAFEPLSKAYSMDKSDPDRAIVMEKCLRDAAGVPFEILQLACEAIDLQRDFAAKGSKLMVSDAATGAAILRGAMLGAAVNVKVNTHLMKDTMYATAINATVDALVEAYKEKADAIFDSVYAGF